MLTGSALVTISLLGCGDVDPGKNDPQAGSGGDTSEAGQDTGGSAGSGATPSEGGSAAAPGEGGAGGEPPVVNLEPLLPWATGNTWTYQVTQDGIVSEKVTTIGDEIEVGGAGPNADRVAFHVITTKGTNGNDKTESWQGPADDEPLRIVRYREQSFSASTGDLTLDEYWDPPKIHIDGSAERTVAGASWLETYMETKLEVGLPPVTHEARDRWTVLADDVTLTVPAGTFENVIHLSKSGASATAKEYWYVRGVGKLKETGTQTEELVDYEVKESAP